MPLVFDRIKNNRLHISKTGNPGPQFNSEVVTSSNTIWDGLRFVDLPGGANKLAHLLKDTFKIFVYFWKSRILLLCVGVGGWGRTQSGWWWWWWRSSCSPCFLSQSPEHTRGDLLSLRHVFLLSLSPFLQNLFFPITYSSLEKSCNKNIFFHLISLWYFYFEEKH